MSFCVDYCYYIINHTNGNQPRFIFTMDLIEKFQQRAVLKDHSRCFKRNTVFLPIDPRLFFVPFKQQPADAFCHIRHSITFFISII